MQKCQFFEGVCLIEVISIEIILWDFDQCPSYRCVHVTCVRLLEVMLQENDLLLGQLKLSVLERCPSYVMSSHEVLLYFNLTVFTVF